MYQILLIDDDISVRNTLQMALERAGHKVFTASNGSQIETDIARAAPDFIVTDLMMPETDGIETIQRIRKRCPDVNVIAISGGGRTGNLDFLSYSASFGANATLQKPFLPRVLLDLIDTLGKKSR